MSEPIVSLDIGTHKIAGMVAVVNNGTIEIIGAEHIEYEEEIVQKGRVIDIEGCTEYIKRVLSELEQQTNMGLPLVNISIGGGFIRGWTAFHKLDLESPKRRITELDIDNLLKNVKNESKIQPESHILRLLAQEYIIDNETSVKKNPKGMFGSSLGALVHICVVLDNPLENIFQCIKNAGSTVDCVYPHSWASAEALVSDEEKRSGVVVIDFGKGTTDFLVYSDGNLYGTYSVRCGSEYIDMDLARIFNISMETASEIKKQYGWCNYPELLTQKPPEFMQQIELRLVGSGAKIYVGVDKISKFVYERVEDIMNNWVKHIIENDMKKMPRIGAGIVLTGGASQLKGLVECVSGIFNKPARIGIPKGVLGLAASYQYPCFSAVVGTLLLRKKELEKREPQGPDWINKLRGFKEKTKNFVGKIWREW
ncbi:MAG: cell division protein FtsA [Candidatus Omnitrophica bacterium]|nr:cell division protein FtsA [Candidatus Omnitrophota bacterium]MCM8817490.1 cell division protein FtsA [Candidatus Omnitrophota bacterium]